MTASTADHRHHADTDFRAHFRACRHARRAYDFAGRTDSNARPDCR
ncbi:MAG TPA: hypothetical protein VNQ81_08610 [Povalibacter sp.]|nr:hypothetical protein [Povalibacter sp.]